MLNTYQLLKHNVLLSGVHDNNNLSFYHGRCGIILRIFEYGKDDDAEIVVDFAYKLLERTIIEYRLHKEKRNLVNSLSVALLITEGFKRRHFDVEIDEECAIFDRTIFKTRPAKINSVDQVCCLQLQYWSNRYILAKSVEEGTGYLLAAQNLLKELEPAAVCQNSEAMYLILFISSLNMLCEQSELTFFKGQLAIYISQLKHRLSRSSVNQLEYYNIARLLNFLTHLDHVDVDAKVNIQAKINWAAVQFLFATDFKANKYEVVPSVLEKEYYNSIQSLMTLNNLGLIDGIAGLSCLATVL